MQAITWICLDAVQLHSAAVNQPATGLACLVVPADIIPQLRILSHPGPGELTLHFTTACCCTSMFCCEVRMIHCSCLTL